MVQPCIGLNSVALLASNWFGEKERSIALSLGTIANMLGNGVIFVVGPAVVSEGSDIPMLMLYTGLAATLVSVTIFLFIQEKPPTPPSAVSSAETTDSNNYWNDIANCFKEKHYLLIFFGYGLAYASFVSLMNLTNEIFIEEKYSSVQAGNAGAIMLVCGIVGAFITGVILDRMRRYVLVLRIGIVLSLSLIHI
eukprot:TRINITY_DN2854_c0_g2_i1.p1 TRINITY_DN2854_c0_g2~~TRINITY_DN2854_c0_g2_i1.p1  ORF type:complete len:194 (-),score=18.81 TRINITY_DN2854_c0_g2_i1:23-604(-)